MFPGLEKTRDTQRNAEPAPLRLPPSLAQRLEANPSFEEFWSSSETQFFTAKTSFSKTFDCLDLLQITQIPQIPHCEHWQFCTQRFVNYRSETVQNSFLALSDYSGALKQLSPVIKLGFRHPRKKERKKRKKNITKKNYFPGHSDGLD